MVLAALQAACDRDEEPTPSCRDWVVCYDWCLGWPSIPTPPSAVRACADTCSQDTGVRWDWLGEAGGDERAWFVVVDDLRFVDRMAAAGLDSCKEATSEDELADVCAVAVDSLSLARAALRNRVDCAEYRP